MPKREENAPEEAKVVKMEAKPEKVVESPLWKKLHKLLAAAGVAEKVAEHEERVVKVEGGKLTTQFVTFEDGKESIKEVLYHFFSTPNMSEYDNHFLEVNGEEEILMFYKDDRQA